MDENFWKRLGGDSSMPYSNSRRHQKKDVSHVWRDLGIKMGGTGEMGKEKCLVAVITDDA